MQPIINKNFKCDYRTQTKTDEVVAFVILTDKIYYKVKMY